MPATVAIAVTHLSHDQVNGTGAGGRTVAEQQIDGAGPQARACPRVAVG
jgi:hypothetical protein